MTDRARLTVERVEQIREYALAGKVDTILVQEQECVALCDHALSDLRRESAAPDGGLSGSEIENIKLHYFGREGDQSADGMDISTVRKLCNMALRSLERPAGRVVPEELLKRIDDALQRALDDRAPRRIPVDMADADILQVEISKLLAASPPAATEGWVSVPTEDDPIVGHKTLRDGSHIPLHRKEADAIIARVNAATERRRVAMPDEQSALQALGNAYQRLRDFDWNDAIYCPKDGSEFFVIEAGSTGIHTAHYQGEWPDGYWLIHDDGDLWPSRPILYKLGAPPTAKHPSGGAK